MCSNLCPELDLEGAVSVRLDRVFDSFISQKGTNARLLQVSQSGRKGVHSRYALVAELLR